MNREWWVPLTGVGFVVVAIIGFIVGGEPPDADSAPREIVNHYVDNKDSIEISCALVVVAGVLLIFFAGYLRRVLRAAEGEGGMLSPLVVIGAGVMAVGVAIDSAIAFSIAESAEDISPVGVQALQAYWDNDFFPIVLGATVLLLSAGISIVRHGALPKWLGWIAILLGILGMTPAGFVTFLGGGLWILVASILLTLRARTPAAPQPGS